MTKLSRNSYFPDREPLIILRRSPQFPYPLHNHDFSELVIVYEGTGTHFSPQSAHRIFAGDVFVINGTAEHGYRDTENLCLINILFLPETLVSIFDLPLSAAFHLLFTLEPEFRYQNSTAGFLRLTPKQLAGVMKLVAEMESETERKENGYQMLVTGCFMQLAALLTRYYEHEANPIPTKMRQISEIMAYLQNNYRGKISIKQLCASAGMSESTLSRAFKQATGTSLLDYCNQLRLRYAMRLLRTTDLSISEIAENAGFDDSNYFSRLFKSRLGLSPRIYRQKITLSTNFMPDKWNLSHSRSEKTP